MRRAPRCLLTTSAGPAQDADARAAAHTLVAIKAAQPQPGLADLAGPADAGTDMVRPRAQNQTTRCDALRHAARPRCLLTTSAGPAQDADVSAAAHTLVAIKAAQPQPGPADLGDAAGGNSGPAKRKRGGTEVRRCSPMHASLSAAGAGHARGAAGRGRQCSRACAGGRPVLCRAPC